MGVLAVPVVLSAGNHVVGGHSPVVDGMTLQSNVIRLYAVILQALHSFMTIHGLTPTVVTYRQPLSLCRILYQA